MLSLGYSLSVLFGAKFGQDPSLDPPPPSTPRLTSMLSTFVDNPFNIWLCEYTAVTSFFGLLAVGFLRVMPVEALLFLQAFELFLHTIVHGFPFVFSSGAQQQDSLLRNTLPLALAAFLVLAYSMRLNWVYRNALIKVEMTKPPTSAARLRVAEAAAATAAREASHTV